MIDKPEQDSQLKTNNKPGRKLPTEMERENRLELETTDIGNNIY